MKTKQFGFLVLLLLAVLIVGAPAIAHHGSAAYDTEGTTVQKVTIT